MESKSSDSSKSSNDLSLTQTNFREAVTTAGSERNVLFVSWKPGHHIPGTPPQRGAPEWRRIGSSRRLASASPCSQVPYQAIEDGGAVQGVSSSCTAQADGERVRQKRKRVEAFMNSENTLQA
jgi:hypothetical protein